MMAAHAKYLQLKPKWSSKGLAFVTAGVLSFWLFMLILYQSAFPSPSLPSSIPTVNFITRGVSRPIFERASNLLRRGDVSPSSGELLANTIGFGIPAWLFFFLRIGNRVFILGSLRLGDYFIIAAMCFYTSMLFFINYSSSYATNLYPPEDAAAIFADPKDVADRIYGSKLVIPLEQSMLATTWLVKLCIWYFVSLLGDSTKWQKPMRWLLYYIIAGYVTIQICYYAILCRPFKQYWAMPVTNPQCTTYQHYSIIQMVFNISSDLILISIPLRICYTVKLPRNRKFFAIIPFTLGFVTIACAIMNKYYNFASPMTTTYQLWYIREASVAIWVGNIICTWQLYQKAFGMLNFSGKSKEIRDDDGQSPNSPRTRTSSRNRHGKFWDLGIGGLMSTWGDDTKLAETELESRVTTGTSAGSGSKKRTSDSEELINNTAMMILDRGDGDATHALDYRKNHDIV